MRWVAVALVGVGCGAEEEAVVEVAELALRALAVAGEGGEPLDGAMELVNGGQGGFHAELGAAVVSPSQDVALTVSYFDADGARIGGTLEDKAVLIELVDWDPASGEGWITTSAFFGTGSSSEKEAACALDGEPVHVVVQVCEIFGEACSEVEADATAWVESELCAGA